VPTVPASFLTFGQTVLYRVYADGPGMWGISAITDQRAAGLLMKIVGGFILWSVIAWYFFKWFVTEEREGIDVLEWGKVEGDLNRMELTR
jgi:cytochrome c oxidase assembly factor CtaG